MPRLLTHIETDIVVVGGGAAGIAAACTAARLGKDVYLIEKNGFLGGMATSAYVGTICGAYTRENTDQFNYVVEGFLKEFCDALALRSKSNPIKGHQHLKFLPYERMAFMSLGDDLLSEAGVHVLLHTTACDVKVTESKITHIEAISSGMRLSIKANEVIDTTGYAVLANLIPAQEIIQSESYQAGALVFGLSDLQVDSEHQMNLHLAKLKMILADDEKITSAKLNLSLVPGSLRDGHGQFKLAIPLALHGSVDAYSRAERYGRKWVLKYVELLRKHVAPLHQTTLVSIAPSVGMRTGPRYQGVTTLMKAAVLNGEKNTKSAARGCWPIEFWPPGERVQMEYFEEGDYYDIPLSCLTSNVMSNLYFAGRHISAEEEAIASARVIGTCLQMGESLAAFLSKK